jgi:hypothetical protein
MNGDAAELRLEYLALTGVDAGANLETDIPDSRHDGLCAPDRPRRPVESGEKSVAGGVELSTVEAEELLPHRSVV